MEKSFRRPGPLGAAVGRCTSCVSRCSCATRLSEGLHSARLELPRDPNPMFTAEREVSSFTIVT